LAVAFNVGIRGITAWFGAFRLRLRQETVGEELNEGLVLKIAHRTQGGNLEADRSFAQPASVTLVAGVFICRADPNLMNNKAAERFRLGASKRRDQAIDGVFKIRYKLRQDNKSAFPERESAFTRKQFLREALP